MTHLSDLSKGDVIVKIVGNSYSEASSNSGRIHLLCTLREYPWERHKSNYHYFQQWLKQLVRQAVQPWYGNRFRKKKIWIETCLTLLKNWSCFTSFLCRGVYIYKYIYRERDMHLLAFCGQWYHVRDLKRVMTDSKWESEWVSVCVCVCVCKCCRYALMMMMMIRKNTLKNLEFSFDSILTPSHKRLIRRYF